jgi:hypothetical protein
MASEGYVNRRRRFQRQLSLSPIEDDDCVLARSIDEEEFDADDEVTDVENADHMLELMIGSFSRTTLAEPSFLKNPIKTTAQYQQHLRHHQLVVQRAKGSSTESSSCSSSVLRPISSPGVQNSLRMTMSEESGYSFTEEEIFSFGNSSSWLEDVVDDTMNAMQQRSMEGSFVDESVLGISNLSRSICRSSPIAIPDNGKIKKSRAFLF